MQATQCRLPVHVRECGGLGWVQATRGVVCLGAREMEGLGQKQARDVIHLCMRCMWRAWDGASGAARVAVAGIAGPSL